MLKGKAVPEGYFGVEDLWTMRVEILRTKAARAQSNEVEDRLSLTPRADCRFCDDGRIRIDNNTVKRAIRPIALGRKNHLFAGSDGGAARCAVVASLVTTAKFNDVEPFAYGSL